MPNLEKIISKRVEYKDGEQYSVLVGSVKDLAIAIETEVKKSLEV